MLLEKTKRKINTMGLSETHLYEGIPDEIVDIDGNFFLGSDRKAGWGGAVGCYIKKGMVWQRGRELKKENIEAIWIEVYFKHSKSLLLCNVYRSHDNSKYLDSNFEAYFDKMLSESVRECSRGQRNIFTWRHKC